ncbi:hypothetical protein [Paenibacillus sp. YAF4_2]|uniref:hypothetical protein n=1 Tax=Paenibacillus sp. YAF4_2 TaxID=3233085 RepID=UPI003F9741D8
MGTNITIVQMFKGRNENWAATYYVYKNIDSGSISDSRLFLKYLGKKPYPTGKVTLYYDIGDGVTTVTPIYNDSESENGIYVLTGIGKREGESIDSKTTIKLQVYIGKASANIELKSVSYVLHPVVNAK